MTSTTDHELIDSFTEFYRTHYHSEITTFAQQYTDETRSLYIDYDDLSEFDEVVAQKFQEHPEQVREYAEEALRTFDFPANISLDDATVRLTNLPTTITVTDIDIDDHIGTFVSLNGIVRETSDVHPEITESAFTCQRCGSAVYLPQDRGSFETPHECPACERQGPFKLDPDASEYVESQTLQLMDDPETLPRGVTPDQITVELESELPGEVTAGERVVVNGTVHIKKADSDDENPIFALFMKAVSFEHEETPVETDSPHPNLNLHPEDLTTFTNLANIALSTTPETEYEQETQTKIITPFVEALGWNKYDSREVRVEYTEPQTSKRPDYALFGPESDTPVVIIEAKRMGKKLDANEEQLHEYLRDYSTEWGVLTNGEEFRICRWNNNTNQSRVVASLRLEELSESPIVNNLQRDAFYGSSKHSSSSDVDSQLLHEVHQIVADFEDIYRHKGGTPIEEVNGQIEKEGLDQSLVDDAVEVLQNSGVIKEPTDGILQTIVSPDPTREEDSEDVTTDSTSKEQLRTTGSIKEAINETESEHENGVPISVVLDTAEAKGIDRRVTATHIEKLRFHGEIYEPKSGHLRTT